MARPSPDPVPPFAVIVPAAGSSQRMGPGHNKLWAPLAGQPLLAHTLRAVARAAPQQLLLVLQPQDQPRFAELAAELDGKIEFAPGGDTRQESVANGLARVDPEVPFVAVHDAARPLVDPGLFLAAVRSADQHGSGVAAVPLADTLKEVEEGRVVGSLDRHRTWAMQTPQAFRTELLRAAHEAAASSGFQGTDEASLVARLEEPVHVVLGDPANLKVTRPEDLRLAEAWLAGSDRSARENTAAMRVGYGYDVHRLAPGRELWLGGVRLEHPLGLAGHSDADALLHAICDALLGAIGAGDIGHHFPDTDPQWKDVASLRLLEAVAEQVAQAGYQVANLDATVVAEAPRIAPHLAAMRERIAAALLTVPAHINIKATTHEGLGALGAGEGIAAHAVVALSSVQLFQISGS